MQFPFTVQITRRGECHPFDGNAFLLNSRLVNRKTGANQAWISWMSKHQWDLDWWPVVVSSCLNCICQFSQQCRSTDSMDREDWHSLSWCRLPFQVPWLAISHFWVYILGTGSTGQVRDSVIVLPIRLFPVWRSQDLSCCGTLTFTPRPLHLLWLRISCLHGNSSQLISGLTQCRTYPSFYIICWATWGWSEKAGSWWKIWEGRKLEGGVHPLSLGKDTGPTMGLLKQ